MLINGSGIWIKKVNNIIAIINMAIIGFIVIGFILDLIFSAVYPDKYAMAVNNSANKKWYHRLTGSLVFNL